jgi:hypothetical protein
MRDNKNFERVRKPTAEISGRAESEMGAIVAVKFEDAFVELPEDVSPAFQGADGQDGDEGAEHSALLQPKEQGHDGHRQDGHRPHPGPGRGVRRQVDRAGGRARGNEDHLGKKLRGFSRHHARGAVHSRHAPFVQQVHLCGLAADISGRQDAVDGFTPPTHAHERAEAYAPRHAGFAEGEKPAQGVEQINETKGEQRHGGEPAQICKGPRDFRGTGALNKPAKEGEADERDENL